MSNEKESLYLLNNPVTEIIKDLNDESSKRMERIRKNLEHINKLMAELKELN